MRPITRRLRLFAAVLGLAQGAVPALALAHELVARDAGPLVAHAESQGTTHDVAGHSHECGLCRNVISKVALPAAQPTSPGEDAGSSRCAWAGCVVPVNGDDGSDALPRGPPVD